MSAAFCNNCGSRSSSGLTLCLTCGAAVREVAEPTTQVLERVLDSCGDPSAEPKAGDPAPRATLEVLRGPNVGARFVLGPITAIGRSPENAVFLDDVSVSRSHARITEAGPGRFVISDLESLNGTYLAGERVDDAILAHGDVLQIGMYKLVFVEGI